MTNVARTIGLGLGLVAGGALAWGTLVERRLFTVRSQQARMPGLNAAAVRILHLSDLHMAPWQRDKVAWIRRLAELKPDLVIVTGDFMGHPDALPQVRHALEVFEGTPGAFVFGSNDYFASKLKNPFGYFSGPSRVTRTPQRLDTEALRQFLVDDLAWIDLNNTAGRMTVNGVDIDLVGVNDPHIHYDRCDAALEALDDLRTADQPPQLSSDEELLGSPSAHVTIGVTHAPYQRILNAFTASGVELLLAGHTHGGQVCVPGFGALVTNCDIPRKQANGMSHWQAGGKRAVLNVSAGLGTSIYAPVRFACPPEVTVIDLSAESALAGDSNPAAERNLASQVQPHPGRQASRR